jgi:hypothetical protein
VDTLYNAMIGATLFASVAVSAMAQTSQPGIPGTFYVVGRNISCGQWTQDRQSNPSLNALDKIWLLGFITGMNSLASMVAPRTALAGSNTEEAGLMAWVNNYCRAHPLDSLTTAAASLWVDLNNQQRQSVPPSAEIPSDTMRPK